MSEDYSIGYARGYEAGQQSILKLAEQPAQQESAPLLPEVDICMRAEAHGIDPSTPGLYGFYVDCISSSPQPAQQEPTTLFETFDQYGEGWERLAWELCAEEHGEDACSELIWEGGPIPEPWGDRWLKYEDEAKRLIALVHKCTTPQPPAQPEQPAQQEPVAVLLLQSKQNFERNFGPHWQADWIYSDLADLLADTRPQAREPEQPAQVAEPRKQELVAGLSETQAKAILDLALDLEKTGRLVSMTEGQERTDFVARNRNIQCALEDALRNATTPQPPAQQEPMFWYRPRSDGMYEGPIHNAQIEQVRKDSGGWHPIYTHPQAREPLSPEQTKLLWHKARICAGSNRWTVFKKLIEAAHGITGEKK